MRWLLLSRAVRSFGQAMLVIAVPLYLAAAGYSAQRIGYLLSIASFGAMLMVLSVGVISDRYGRKPALAGIALLAAIGAASYALTTNFWVLAIMAGLASVGRGGAAGSGGNWGPFFPAEQPLIAESVTAQQRNGAFAALSIVGAAAAAARLAGGWPARPAARAPALRGGGFLPAAVLHRRRQRARADGADPAHPRAAP
ncbi:MAG TPA: MFS transporter [Chloroflexota bacterium]|nr:MFS transporter [Chloroflexota bacterium]